MEDQEFLERCDTFALIEINAGGTCSLRCAINPDAMDPLQCESFGSEWTLPIQEATRSIEENGFWATLMEINDKVSGGIDLNDGLSIEEAKAFIGFNDHMHIIGNDLLAAIAISCLPVGTYLFIIDT